MHTHTVHACIHAIIFGASLNRENEEEQQMKNKWQRSKATRCPDKELSFFHLGHI